MKISKLLSKRPSIINKRMKLKTIFQSILLGAAFFAAPLVYAAENPENTVRIEVFERQECGHCQAEKAFLNQLQKERHDLILVFHDIAEAEHKDLFVQLTDLEEIPKVTPITIIDSVVLQGFDTPQTTGRTIRELIERAKAGKQYTFEEFIAAGGSQELLKVEGTCDAGEVCAIEQTEFYVSIPLIGAVDVARYSLPTMALILGFVDGFNPCAMWVLVLFLTILLEAGSRRRMFEMAGLFIFAEAVMYYLILNVWMTAWDFVGMDRIITPLVGLVAVRSRSVFSLQFL